MFGKLKLLLEFIFGFELFQNNEILRTAGKFKFTGESVLNKLSTNFKNKNKIYYPFTNMVVHYFCINDVVINEKTKVLQLRWCLFFGWHSVNFWRQSGNRGRFSLLPGCTLFLGVYCTRARESMRLAMKGAPHCWILTIFSSGQPNTIDVKTFWDCALAGKVQLKATKIYTIFSLTGIGYWPYMTSLFTSSQSKLEDHVKLSKIEEKLNFRFESN